VGADDWRYFFSFSHPVPRNAWNITRIFPETLMPLTGYFSAFLIYPLVGDYLYASSISLALVMAFFVALLFVCLYGLFYAISKSKLIGTLTAMMTIALCFALFKGNSVPADNVPTLFVGNNVHMFYAKAYNLYFFYVFPNILNSVIVLILMRKNNKTQKLSFVPEVLTAGEVAKSGCLLVAIYFGIFSMLFSAGILFSFAVVVIVHRFLATKKKNWLEIKKFGGECWRDYNIAVVTIVGMLVAMILELQSGRSNAAHHETTYFGSLFSAEFVKRIGEAAGQFFTIVGAMNKLAVLLLLIVIVTAIILYIFKTDSRKNRAIGLMIESVAAAVFLFFFYILVAAKGGPTYLAAIRCSYGVFFFLILAFGLICVFVLQELKLSLLFFPLILTIIILLVPNQMWPYYSVSRSQDHALIHAIVPVLVEADSMDVTEIELYLPEGALEKWQYDWLASLLYQHRVTVNKITIVDVNTSSDNSVSFAPLR
jgi:hypothetical protein